MTLTDADVRAKAKRQEQMRDGSYTAGWRDRGIADRQVLDAAIDLRPIHDRAALRQIVDRLDEIDDEPC